MYKIYSTLFLCYNLFSAFKVSKGISDDEISTIYRIVAELEKEVRTSRAENHAVQKTLTSVLQDNQKMREEISTMKNKNDKLNVEMEKLKEKNDMLGEMMKLLVTSSDQINEQTESVLQDNKTYHIHIDAKGKGSRIKTNRAKRLLVNSVPTTPVSPLPTQPTQPAQVGNMVAFHAYNPNHQENLGIHQTVEFPTAVTNIGSAYNTASSIFRAPEDGLYFFSATILSFPGEDMDTEIVHNGNGVVYTYSGGESMFGSGSASAVIQLKAYDDIWVRILDVRSVNSGNIRVFSDKWSSFCGYRIA